MYNRGWGSLINGTIVPRYLGSLWIIWYASMTSIASGDIPTPWNHIHAASAYRGTSFIWNFSCPSQISSENHNLKAGSYCTIYRPYNYKWTIHDCYYVGGIYPASHWISNIPVLTCFYDWLPLALSRMLGVPHFSISQHCTDIHYNYRLYTTWPSSYLVIFRRQLHRELFILYLSTWEIFGWHSRKICGSSKSTNARTR